MPNLLFFSRFANFNALLSIRRIAFWLSVAVAFSPGIVCARRAAALPEYRPEKKVSGVIRSWGSNHMGTLMRNWEEGFRKYHPNVWFEDSLKGTASAQFGLHENVADLALSGRQIFPYEYYGIYRRSQLRPVEIAVATGSYDVQSKSTALGIFVSRDNPVSRLSLKQLDGIFGAQRTGGWQGLEWAAEAARSDKGNIRTWGQLGLSGEWADKPIHVYGPPGIYPGGVSFFQARVMGGADTWNEALQEFDNRKIMIEALSKDPYGIAYCGMSYKTPLVKQIALSENSDGPYVLPTKETVANRTYPLARFAYIYFAPDRPTGDPANPRVNPMVKEFLRYILSRQGQRDVAREGDYLPLTAGLVGEQLRKLE
jgi:phosphate transport system substrate-binding protein